MMHITPYTRWHSSIVPVLKFYSVLLSLFFMALPTQAEQKQVFGRYEVHYIAINSTEITTEVAKQYQLTRSRQLALLNISVLEAGSNDQDLPTPVNATLNGRMENLIGQRQTLSFQRVQEGQAVYYLAQFEFDDEDTYRFIIDVKPETGERSYTVKFSQKLYREN